MYQVALVLTEASGPVCAKVVCLSLLILAAVLSSQGTTASQRIALWLRSAPHMSTSVQGPAIEPHDAAAPTSHSDLGGGGWKVGDSVAMTPKP